MQMSCWEYSVIESNFENLNLFSYSYLKPFSYSFSYRYLNHLLLVNGDFSCDYSYQLSVIFTCLVQRLSATWRCSIFFAWTEWILIMALWWQHCKHCPWYCHCLLLLFFKIIILVNKLLSCSARISTDCSTDTDKHWLTVFMLFAVLTGFDVSNKYQVKNTLGQQIYFVAAGTSSHMSMLCWADEVHCVMCTGC